MRSRDSRATAAAPATPVIFASATSTSAPEILARTAASASTITAPTRASVGQDSAATTAIRSSTNANRRLASTAALAQKRKKVTLSACVAKVLRDSFVKSHLNAPTVRAIRNVSMVSAFVNTAWQVKLLAFQNFTLHNNFLDELCPCRPNPLRIPSHTSPLTR